MNHKVIFYTLLVIDLYVVAVLEGGGKRESLLE